MKAQNQQYFLTKQNRVSFALAGFGQNLIIGVVNSYILFFYTDVFLLGKVATSILMIVARIWDALNDPIMGTIVDKTRTRFGKMRPYILFITIPLIISTALLFVVPNGFSNTSKIIYAYSTYLIWGMAYTVCDVPFWGLASAMTPNAEERGKFISKSRLLHSIGGALPMLIVPLMLKFFGNENGFLFTGIAVGVLGGALFSLAFFGTKERSYCEDKAPTLRETVSFLKTNKPLQKVVGANLLGFLRPLPITAGIYVATYVLQSHTFNIFGLSYTVTGATLNTVLVAGWGVMGFVGMLITPLLTKVFNYRILFTVASLFGAASALTLFFVGANIYAIIICLLLCGLPYGVVTNINYSMIADSIDYVEWKTGKRAEGITISFQTLMNQLMSALQVGLVAVALIAIKFKEPAKIDGITTVFEQSDFTLKGFFFLITILPALGWLLSIIPMLSYKFIGKEREKAQQEIIYRRLNGCLPGEEKKIPEEYNKYLFDKGKN